MNEDKNKKGHTVTARQLHDLKADDSSTIEGVRRFLSDLDMVSDEDLNSVAETSPERILNIIRRIGITKSPVDSAHVARLVHSLFYAPEVPGLMAVLSVLATSPTPLVRHAVVTALAGHKENPATLKILKKFMNDDEVPDIKRALASMGFNGTVG